MRFRAKSILSMALIAGIFAAVGIERVSAAGFNTTSHFVAPGEFEIGVEPELTLTDGAGMAGNLRFTEGLTDLTNVTGILGTGGGPRQFRVGGNMAFDFFPDVQGQPGIGIAGQAIYYRLGVSGTTDTLGQLELTAAPYIHKAFKAGGGEVEPFLAIPLGLAFSDGDYRAISTITIGSMFKASPHVSYVAEFGLAVNNAESYFACGISYYH
jgi:hypothetical protein